MRGICGNGSASFRTWVSAGDGARPGSSRAGPHPRRAVTLRGQARVRAAAGARPARTTAPPAAGPPSGRRRLPRSRPVLARALAVRPHAAAPRGRRIRHLPKGKGRAGRAAAHGARPRDAPGRASRSQRAAPSRPPGRPEERAGGRASAGAAARVGWDVGSRGADGAAAPQRLGPPRASRRRGRGPSCAPVCPGEPEPRPPKRPHTEAQSTGHSNRAGPTARGSRGPSAVCPRRGAPAGGEEARGGPWTASAE